MQGLGNNKNRCDQKLTCSRSLVSNDLTESTPQCLEVFTLHGDDLQAMTGKGFRNIITLEVFTGVAGNSDVIVINYQLYVEVLSNSESGCLSVVTLLLGAVGTQDENSLVPIGECDTVDPGPDVPKTARREPNTRRETEFRVSWEFRVRFTIVEQMFEGDVSFDGGDEVLSSNTMACEASKYSFIRMHSIELDRAGYMRSNLVGNEDLERLTHQLHRIE